MESFAFFYYHYYYYYYYYYYSTSSSSTIDPLTLSSPLPSGCVDRVLRLRSIMNGNLTDLHVRVLYSPTLLYI